MAPLRRAIADVKQRWSVIGWGDRKFTISISIMFANLSHNIINLKFFPIQKILETFNMNGP
jgi:hypothetical protein